jgi:retron-type reverse transcriptase
VGLFDFFRDLFRPVRPSPEARPSPGGGRTPAQPAKAKTRGARMSAELLRAVQAGQGKAALAARLGVPAKDLDWLARESGDHYVRREIPKRSGGSRAIESPKRRLKAAQRAILGTILSQGTPSAHAHGFAKGRSPLTNARGHVGAKLMFQFDLKDFFWQVRFRRVFGIFRKLGQPPDACLVLARLCCHRGRLPQGAPTSPSITNRVCRRMDARLAGAMKRRGGTYTRYADDLTFSFPSGRASWPATRALVFGVLKQEGFLWNREKSRIRRAGSRMSVTGVTVNVKASPPRREVRNLRALLHDAKRNGAAAANRNGVKQFAQHVRGRIEAVRAVDKGKGEKLLAAYREVTWG